MIKYLRQQTDNQHDAYARLVTVDRDPKEKNRVRPEDAHDLNINVILQRSGLIGLTRRQQINGEINYDMDRFQALAAVADARRFWQRLPQPLRDKYPSWQDVLKAMDEGTLRKDVDEYNKQVRIEADKVPSPTPEVPPNA